MDGVFGCWVGAPAGDSVGGGGGGAVGVGVAVGVAVGVGVEVAVGVAVGVDGGWVGGGVGVAVAVGTGVVVEGGGVWLGGGVPGALGVGVATGPVGPGVTTTCGFEDRATGVAVICTPATWFVVPPNSSSPALPLCSCDRSCGRRDWPVIGGNAVGVAIVAWTGKPVHPVSASATTGAPRSAILVRREPNDRFMGRKVVTGWRSAHRETAGPRGCETRKGRPGPAWFGALISRSFR